MGTLSPKEAQLPVVDAGGDGGGHSHYQKRGEGPLWMSPAWQAFVEACRCDDVLLDLLACFEIDAHEFSQAFMKKYSKNMAQDYASEYKEYLQSK